MSPAFIDVVSSVIGQKWDSVGQLRSKWLPGSTPGKHEFCLVFIL